MLVGLFGNINPYMTSNRMLLTIKCINKKIKIEKKIQQTSYFDCKVLISILTGLFFLSSTGAAAVPRTNSQVRISSSEAAAQQAEGTEDDAAEILKMIEAEDKFR